MNKLMCRFVTTTKKEKKKKKKIPDPNQDLDTACPAGIPCNDTRNSDIPGNELDECGLLSLFGARW